MVRWWEHQTFKSDESINELSILVKRALWPKKKAIFGDENRAQMSTCYGRPPVQQLIPIREKSIIPTKNTPRKKNTYLKQNTY